MEIKIRRAEIIDAKEIHESHMRSIQELCANDHTPLEISGWGHRPFNEELRIHAITHHQVYVVTLDDKIEGHINFNIVTDYPNETVPILYINALYLTSNVEGRGIGKKFLEIVLEEAKKHSIDRIKLHSTINAHAFYLKYGFVDCGTMMTVKINGVDVRCIPMEKKLA